jgi:hypothetical protein
VVHGHDAGGQPQALSGHTLAPDLRPESCGAAFIDSKRIANDATHTPSVILSTYRFHRIPQPP